jgi:hypothetical protein
MAAVGGEGWSWAKVGRRILAAIGGQAVFTGEDLDRRDRRAGGCDELIKVRENGK